MKKSMEKQKKNGRKALKLLDLQGFL